MATNYIEAAIRGARRSPTPKDALEMEMMLPDYGFGPMSQVTKAGRPNPELTQGRGTLGERTGRALLEYGPLPAKFAVEVAKQPVRAGEAVGGAAFDPTLANVTNAGVQTGVALFQPAKAAMMMAGGYGVAGARDAGLGSLFSSEAYADGDDPLDAKSRKRLERLMKLGSLSRAEREEKNSYLEIIKAKATADAQAKARAGEAAAIEKIKADGAKAASEQRSFDDAVVKAETAKAKELARDRRFSESDVGKMWDKFGVITPALLAAGLGGLSRASSGGGTMAKDYLVPGAVGLGTGAVAANYPLIHNSMFTEPDNPERRAYEAYGRELPPGHQRKQEWLDYAKTLPQENPVQAVARKELYDPVKLAERSTIGAIEGVLGGLAGSEVARLPGRLSEGFAAMPGRVRAARTKSMTDAEVERLVQEAAIRSLNPAKTQGSPRSVVESTKLKEKPGPSSVTTGLPRKENPTADQNYLRPLERSPVPQQQTIPQAKPPPVATLVQPSSGASSSAKTREIPLSKTDKDKISNAVYQKLGRDGSLDGLTYQDLGIKLSGKSATPENVSAYIQQLVSVSDDLAKAGIPPGSRQAELLKRIRASKLALPATAVGAGSINYLEDDRNQ